MHIYILLNNRKVVVTLSSHSIKRRYSPAKKVLGVLATAVVAVTLIGLPAVSASAHVPEATSTCTTLSVNLTQYKDMVPAGEASSTTTYQRYSWTGNPSDSNPATSSPSTEPGNWQVDNKPKPGDDLIGQSFQEGNGENASWFYWTSTTVVTPGTPAQVNTVTVSINGVQVDAANFGASFVKDYPFADSTVANDWSVTVVAWDGPTNPNWSKTITGTSSPCVDSVVYATAAGFTVDPATCTSGEILHRGAITHATWDGAAEGTEGPADVLLFANADEGYTFFSDGTTQRTFAGTLAGPLTEGCGTGVMPTAPTVTQATGVCVDNQWSATAASVVIKNTAEYVYDDYGQDADGNLAITTAGVHTFHVTAVGDNTIADGNGFVNGTVSVTIDPAPAAQDCATVVYPICTGSSTLPVSTNLNQQGWVVKNGTYVDGGLKLGSPTEDSYVYMTLPAPVHLSELAPLGFSATDAPWGAILVYNDDYSVNVHYEPYYSNPLWTNSVGILPAGGDGQGSAMSGDFSDLLSNPMVTEIAFWVNAGHEATLHNLTFNCMVQSFDKAVVTEVKPIKPTWVDECGPDNGHWVLPEQDGVVYTTTTNKNGSITVTATAANENYVLTGKTKWTKKDSGELCPVGVIPNPPTFVDVCGITNDEVNPPTDTDAVKYTVDDQRIDGVGIVTVTATAKEGYFIDLGDSESATTQTWSHDFTNEACPVTVVNTPPKLAYTGLTFDPTTWWWAAGGVLFGAALFAFPFWVRRRTALAPTE